MPVLVVNYSDEDKTEELAAAICGVVPEAEIALGDTYRGFIRDTPSDTAIDTAGGELQNHELAVEIATLIRPTKDQLSRKIFLEHIDWGWDSCAMSDADDDLAPRGASSGLARTLSKRFPNSADPLGELFIRQKIYFSDGGYKGVKYVKTELGKRVLKILKDDGSIDSEPRRKRR